VFLLGVMISLVGAALPSEELILQIVFFLLYFLYYFIFESTIGKTPAKFITRTRVVNDQGALPMASSIAGRTLSRFVPFDALSFLGRIARGWHDRWSNAWVIDERKLAVLKGTEG